MSEMYNDQLIEEPLSGQRVIQRAGSNLIKRIKTLESNIKLLNEKIKLLSEENKMLRDINIQNQLDNFKLKQEVQAFKQEASEVEEDDMQYGIDETFEDYDEYVDESQVQFVDIDAKSFPTKRTFSEAYEESEMIEHEVSEIPKEDCKEEYLIDDDGLTEDENVYVYDQKDDIDSKESIPRYLDYPIPHISPEKAYNEIRKIAQQRGASEKLAQIPKGRQGDSTFINRCLELLYDRMVLATSSTRGQKFQGKFDVAPKPALDPKKLNICRQAFLNRLENEGLNVQDDRFKLFHGHVNSKIQNTRKCVKKQKTPIRGFHH